MNKKAIVPGVALILVGIWALLWTMGVEWLRMDRLWPVVLMIVGLLSLYTAATRHEDRADGVWFGVVALLCGGLFAYITMGQGEWGDLSYLWPIFPAIAGAGWIIAWLVDIKQAAHLALGICAGGVAFFGFMFTYNVIGADQGLAILNWWPAVLILMGVGFLVQFVLQRRSPSGSDDADRD